MASALQETQVKVNTVDENHVSALATAVQACQLDAAAFLIEKGSDVNQLMPQVHGDKCLGVGTNKSFIHYPSIPNPTRNIHSNGSPQFASYEIITWQG